MSQFEVQKLLETWRRNDAEVRPMGRLARDYKSEGETKHWHISGLRKGMGTVEVSYLPSTGKLTVLVHDNRRGTWAGLAYEDLAHEIEKRSV
jgi:hypothetical protein